MQMELNEKERIKQRLREITKEYFDEDWIEEEFEYLRVMFKKLLEKEE